MLRTLVPLRRPSRQPCGYGFAVLATATLVLVGSNTLAAQSDGDGFPLTGSEAAQRHLWAGVDDSQNVFPVGAARHYEMALEADPNFGLAKVLHAWQAPGLTGAQRQAGIEEGIGMMSGASGPELTLASAIKEIQAGNGAAGSRTLYGLSQTYPDDPRLAQWAVTFANARGDQTDVAARLTDLNTRFPDFAPPYNTLAYTLWPRGNRAGAMQAVRKYAELNPDHPNPHDSYAEMLQWDGQYQAALQHYARAVELDADYDQGYVGAAETHWLMGHPDQAIAELERAIEHAITPGAAVTYRRAIAHVHLLEGDRDEGMEALAEASSFAEAQGLPAASAFAHETAAVMDAMVGGGDNVEAHLAAAAELRGSQPAIHQGMAAMAHAESENGEGARALAREILENNQAGFWQNFGHTLMAVADLEDEDCEGAMRHLSMADPANPVTQAAMAVCFDEMGREAEARSKWSELENNRQINLANVFMVIALLEKEGH